VQFHFNVPDLQSYTCRLLRKAFGARAQVFVMAPGDVLDALDRALWSFSALDFIPHCLAGASERVRARSPIVLGVDCRQSATHNVLLNLGSALPQGFERFERLIELVGPNAQERQQARLRWRHYTERGYNIIRHDVAAPPAGA
jgi:DNA polymerase-3 subunit chi